MRNALTLGGWIVAGLAFVLSVILYRQSADLRHQLKNADELNMRQQQQLAELGELQQRTEDAATRIEELSKELESAKALAAELNAQGGDAAETPVLDEQAGEQAASEESEKKGSEDAGPSRRERMLSQQMAFMVDMAWGEFFKEQASPDDVKAQVRDLLVKAAVKDQTAVIEALKEGKTPAAEVFSEQETNRAELRAALGGVLSANELTAWDTYEELADVYLYESVVEGQLTMLAPELNTENRRAAGAVVAEELVAAIDEFERSEVLYTLENFNNAQSAALQNSLDRLAQSLDEEQYGHVQSFVEAAEAMFNAVAE